MTDDLVKRLRVYAEQLSGYLPDMLQESADRIEGLEKALEVYAEDCNMECCETIHRQGNGCGYTARAALGEKKE